MILTSDQLNDIFPTEFINLTAAQQKVSEQIYRLLASGQPVPLESIASKTDLSRADVQAILRRWPGVFYDDLNQIVGYWGLALAKTSHRFEVNGQALYTWCAWDTLFIPQIIQSTAQVGSTCAVTGEMIRLTVAPDRIERRAPKDISMSFIVPGVSGMRENLITNFCHYVHFFSSPEAGRKWSSDHEGTFIMSLDEAFNLGREKNKLQYLRTREVRVAERAPR